MKRIENFPFEAYEIHSIEPLGKFYLDNVGDFIKDVLRSGIPWERSVRELIETHAWPGTTAIDIGAHIGCHTLAMAKRVGPQGKVYAFEPQPKLYSELVMNMALNGMDNVEAFCSAIGGSIGEIELSPLKEGNEGATPLAGGSQVFVPITTLDALALDDVSFIKIDVEGMEDQVLVGAVQTLQKNRPVVAIEIMGGYLPETAPEHIKKKIDSVICFFNSLGFAVHRQSAHDYLALPHL